MSISIPSDVRKFRLGVLPLFSFLVGFSLIVFVGGVLILEGTGFNRRALAMAIASDVIVSLILASMFSIVFKVAVSAEGIYGHSFWGWRSFVRWDEVAAAGRFRLLNLPWLRVRSKTDGTTIWLALFLARAAEFRQETQRLAPAGSPVLNQLR